ncbi:MAG: hypothetical protein MUC31_06475 [Bacteroidales bacterium]|jgi:hypothetical protein|nr:hypothetical protein [Bacteroidales bacterium]
MRKYFKIEVKEALGRIKNLKPGIISESDLSPLPVIVQKYLRNSHVMGKEKVVNFRVEMEGTMWSNPGEPGMKIKSVQYNCFEPYTRIFYIKAYKMGIPAVGLHLYKNEKAIMKIKLAGLFTLADARGPEMDQGETVTVFNDMCFMAPATLISNDIRWEILEPLVVKANFTNKSLKISAVLYFDEDGNLVNFISNDRFETKDGREYHNNPWLTPVKEFREINGIRRPAVAKAIYMRPEGEFCYAEFVIKDIAYNYKEMI